MKKSFLAALLLSLSVGAFGQQDYVGRYDAFAGFTYLDTPKLNLMERGFITQEGVNVNRWLAFGFDFSIMDGHSSILPSEITPALQQKLAAGFGGRVPPGLFIPYNSTTSTYTAGPQFNFRKCRKITLFVHPDLGAIHEEVTARPAGALQTAVVAALLPSGKKSDTTYFYGVGGGVTYNATRHIGLRFTVDFVHLYLFDDLLASSRNAVRFGIGPTFNFGKNVAR